jgi:hypothetical protein
MAIHCCEVVGFGTYGHQLRSGGVRSYGTLLRATVCEVLAQTLGRLDHMRQLEALISGLSDVETGGAREMVRWYWRFRPPTSRLG